MERVKPIYLSRTYGVPLPASNKSAAAAAADEGEDESEDKRAGWEPEAFLDTLARMKGRLLKGGEPDREAVAKILLSDWVRGRIPFFVPPPERPEELNAAEAKRAARAEAKGKGKGKAVAVEQEQEQRPIGVKQNLGSIMQKNSFVGDDVRPLEQEEQMDEEDEEDDADEEGENDAEGEAEEEEQLAWNDVFKDDEPSAGAAEDEDDDEDVTTLFSKPDDVDEAASDAEASRTQKKSRMTTNKVCNTTLLRTMSLLTSFPSPEKGDELLLDCQRQEQESRKGCCHEDPAEWRQRRAETEEIDIVVFFCRFISSVAWTARL